MNTEAKQAARSLWVGLPWTHEQLRNTEIAFQQFADAATAKLMEQNNDLRRKLANAVEKWGICANDAVEAADKLEQLEAATAKLREEFEEVMDWKESWEKRAEIAETKLAHQQPSATTPEETKL